ncbi:GNAT family N-acetyltransferase [Brucepastera parasyntrophica]|uniref:GNAT family N-acetyltransferase n=1 Tax=Brucepastera parasyntrophica TaxID=2880008 RepID=UPI002109FA61|nr:GNAT family N-acetyltransferase [Brucepastera parasyntrophica]ULQ61007.1 GNAT family N-acetyltransferase [Brucepastera parasyntrophica]
MAVSEWRWRKEDWLEEIKNRNGKFNFIKHFIVYCNDIQIGFCQYEDCYFLQEVYGEVFDKNHTYGIGYLIGEEEYLNKGIGKIIVKKLEEKIIEIGGKELFADPLSENIASIKTLLSNGFVKIKEGDYRKKLL